MINIQSIKYIAAFVIPPVYFLTPPEYSEYLQRMILVSAIIFIPILSRRKLAESRRSGIPDIDNEFESDLKKRESRLNALIFSVEVLFVLFLIHSFYPKNLYLLTGLGISFIMCFFFFMYCLGSICPKCKQYFYGSQKPKNKVLISSTSISFGRYRFVPTTRSCTNCGITRKP